MNSALVGATAVLALALQPLAFAQAPDTPPVGAAGATPPLATPQASETPSLAEVQAAMAAVEADTTLDEAVKSGLRSKLEEAAAALEKAAEFARRTQEYKEAMASGPNRVSNLRAQLDETESTDVDVAVDESKSTQDLQSEIEVRRARQTIQRAELAEIATAIQRARSRPVEITTRLPELQRELNTIRDQRGALTGLPSTASLADRANALLLGARQARIESELEMLQYEQLSQAIRLELLRAKEAALGREAESSDVVLERLRELLERRLANTADRARAAADALPPALRESDARIGELAEEVVQLADELSQVTRDTQRAITMEQRLRAGLEQLVADFTSIREQLDLGSGGRAMVQVLFALDHRCLAAASDLETLPIPALDRTRLAALRVRERIQLQGQIADQFQRPRPESLDALIEARRAALTDLDRQYGDLVRTLSQLEQGKQSFLDQASEIRSYVAGQLFGFSLQSSPVIDVETFAKLPEALGWAFGPAHWQEVRRGLTHVVTTMPLSTVVVFAVLVFLVLRRRRFVAALRAISSRIGRAQDDRYGHTTAAVGWTLLIAAPAPLVLGYSAWALGTMPDANDWMIGLTAGLLRASWIVLVAAVLSAVMRPGGLGEAHFGWPARLLGPVRRVIRTSLVVYLPALVITVSCSYREASVYFDSLGRISMIAAHLVMAYLIYRLLLSRGGVLESPREYGLEADPTRWHRLGFILLVAAPTSLVALMTAGFVITSLMLSTGLLMTLTLVAAGATLHGFALRWLFIRQRKLALEKRRREADELATPTPVDGGAAGSHEALVGADEEKERLDLEAVGEQSRGLLRAVFVLGTLLVAIFYWSRTFPLADVAGSIEIPFLGGLTTLQLATVFLVGVIAGIVVRNLPGLLELVLLYAADVAPGTRHAIYTLARYAAIAFAAALILDVLDVDWAKFGWIAAALSVGLGFGLQEVVANFVCGLILLFERPIRVRDIVTVEGMTGTVTKIHMRSTTITNWDEQEFVVPNKYLITNTLLNWTLSTSVNRLVIPVGIAYGSDTDEARRLLLQVAADHPRVLDEPQPMATFEQFADSSLNLVLRAYLPNMSNRLATLTDLHTEIHRRFADAGIVIAFPQLDLHVRSGWSTSREEERGT